MTTTRPWWLLPPGRIHPLWWVALGCMMLGIDYLSSESVSFPVVYVIPIILAAWYSGAWPAVGLAIAVPVFRLLFVVMPHSPKGVMGTLALATALRGIVIIILALWFSRLADFERALRRPRQSARRSASDLLVLQEHPQRGRRMGTHGRIYFAPV